MGKNAASESSYVGRRSLSVIKVDSILPMKPYFQLFPCSTCDKGYAESLPMRELLLGVRP
jgi:hypothetical protein